MGSSGRPPFHFILAAPFLAACASLSGLSGGGGDAGERDDDASHARDAADAAKSVDAGHALDAKDAAMPTDGAKPGTDGCAVSCGGACVDEATDMKNCGACGHACATGQPCTAGSCGCPAGTTACDGVCVDERTDPENCGGCALACPTGCSAGECVTEIATGQNTQGAPDPGYVTAGITVAGGAVYWSTYTAGTIVMAPVTGGAVSTLTTGQDLPTSLAVGALTLFWTNSNFPGSVASLPLGGGSVSTLVSVDPDSGGGGAGTPSSIAASADGVYWTSESIVRGRTISTGLPVTLASGLFIPSFLAIDSTSAYWGDGSGNVSSAPIGGGGPVTMLASGRTRVVGLAAGASAVYFADEMNAASSAIVSVPLAGGALSTLATGQYGGGALAVDATHVYWVDANPNGSIVRAGLDGSAVTTLVTAQDEPTAITVDETSVYWLNTGSGTVMRVTPK